MHLHISDAYRVNSSFVHRLDSRVKVIIALAFILCTTLMRDGAWLGFGVLLLVLLGAVGLSRLGLTYTLRRSFIVLPFVLAAVTLPFTLPGQPLMRIGQFVISQEGTLRLVSIIIKSWLSVQMSILLTATTPVNSLMWGLRALRVPVLLVTIVGFMYRYLFVLGDEALRLNRARASRSGSPNGKGGGSLLWRGRVTGNMIGSLAVRAYERGDRIYDAMVARGFDGEIRTLATPTMTQTDWTTLALALALLVGIALAGAILR